MSDPLPEPWLRGALPGIDPYLMPAAHALVLHAAEHAQRHSGQIATTLKLLYQDRS